MCVLYHKNLFPFSLYSVPQNLITHQLVLAQKKVNKSILVLNVNKMRDTKNEIQTLKTNIPFLYLLPDNVPHQEISGTLLSF